MACHCGWGGKIAGQQRPGALVGDGHPAHLLPGGEPGLLDRVDLPNLVGGLGADQESLRALRPSWSIDSGALEGPLEHARRGDLVRHKVAEQFQTDPAGPPGRVVVLELARHVEDGLRGAGGGSPTGVIAQGQPLLAIVAVGAPEGADGVIGESQFGGDLRQGLAVEMAADDVQADLRREGTRHGRISWVSRGTRS